MRYTIAVLAMLGAAIAALPVSADAQQTPKPSKQKPPELGTPKAFKLPPKREFTLANGMKVTLVPFGKIPKVSVVASVRTGNIDEGAKEVWLADVTGEMMREGTTTRSASDIAAQVAGMGGELNVSVANDYTRAGAAVLTERGPEVISLIADVLRNPKLPESELARITATKVRDVAIAKSSPQSVAQEKFLATMYGDHPYGRAYPTEAMLKGYTIRQVKDFYTKNFGAARTHLYIVGVYDATAMENAARQAFGGWARGSPPAINPPSPKATRSFALLDRPDAVQSTIIMGLPVPKPTSKDFTALGVTDALLGGSFGSRITTNIREQKGYTYSPSSYIATHRQDAYWAEQADVTTKFTGASLKEIFGEIERLQQTAPGMEELSGIKNNMVGIFTLQNASRGGIVNQLANVDLQGLPPDHLSTYVQRVMAVTPADVQRMTKAYLRPEAMTLVVVGDKKTVEAQVAPYVKPSGGSAMDHSSMTAAQHAAMQKRGGMAMGVDQYTSRHTFDITDYGGRIALQRDTEDSIGVAQIRVHMRLIQHAFEAGDFSAPAFVHMRDMPGTAVMSKKRALIRYAYAELPRGAEVRITTSDSGARQAIAQFLEAQRSEHRATGTDPESRH